ncbi:MAG: Arginyl-tRNA synthetase, partial [uncultured Thermomicrobiales bacterium]
GLCTRSLRAGDPHRARRAGRDTGGPDRTGDAEADHPRRPRLSRLPRGTGAPHPGPGAGTGAGRGAALQRRLARRHGRRSRAIPQFQPRSRRACGGGSGGSGV